MPTLSTTVGTAYQTEEQHCTRLFSKTQWHMIPTRVEALLYLDFIIQHHGHGAVDQQEPQLNEYPVVGEPTSNAEQTRG